MVPPLFWPLFGIQYSECTTTFPFDEVVYISNPFDEVVSLPTCALAYKERNSRVHTFIGLHRAQHFANTVQIDQGDQFQMNITIMLMKVCFNFKWEAGNGKL